MQEAVQEYLRREEAAMKTPQGADHDELIETVAAEYGEESAALADEVLRSTILRAN
ncbi:hypothetical protein [Epibacterium ulvae]|uniref:hypothetical protein n=1 Tax=Epibacterium ulvae TaxID=1156985 RepID=UPI002493BBD7|nr:hypothetical protein [Epibacterium ulvae]